MAIDVSSLISAADSRANELSDSAERALQAATSALGVISFPQSPTITLPTLSLPTLPQAPTLSPVVLKDESARPVKPSISDIQENFGAIPVPTAPNLSTLSINTPVTPAAAGRFTKAAPQLNIDANLPSAPAAFAGQMPEAMTLSIPDAPTVQLPTFAGVRPVEVDSAPDVNSAMTSTYREISPVMIRALEGEVDAFIDKINPEYRGQLSRLEAKLQEYIDQPRGTGLSPAVEDAIYERMRGKGAAEARRVRDDAATSAARMGFTLPSGALMSAQQTARQEAANNNAKAAVDIAVMQAEMQQKNLQFAITASADLRKVALSSAVAYHGNLISLNGQSVQYAIGVADAIVKTYNLVVEAYRAKLDGYRADVAVFEVLIRASMNEIEIYKAEIDALSALVSVDTNQVQRYRAQIDAHQSAVETYAKQVDAVVAVAGLERLKLDVFRSEVDAYVAEVGGKTAEWQAYSAAWGGEESKVKTYLARSQAYASEVDGYRARITAESSKIEAISRQNQAVLGSYTAEVGAYAAEARANVDFVTAQIRTNESLLQGYQIANQALIAQAGAASEQYRALSQVAVASASMRSTETIESARLLSSTLESRAKIAVSAGGVYAGMAQAALSGMNTLVSAEQA